MPLVKKETIKGIAKDIANGKVCYINRRNAKITVIDPFTEDPKKIATQEKTVAEFELKIEKYLKIEKLSADDQLEIMRNFLKELSDKSVRKQLSNALNRKNPIRNFSQTVESDIELHQHWRNFNTAEYQRWVSDYIIAAYNY